AEEPAKKREPRDARGHGGETDQNGGGDPTADTRGERPEPRVEVHAASLEPIPHLGKRQLRDPRRRRPPPEPEPPRPTASAGRPPPELEPRRPTASAVSAAGGGRRRGHRLTEHRLERGTHLGVANALLHHHVCHILVLTHRVSPPWPPLHHPGRRRGSRQMRT